MGSTRIHPSMHAPGTVVSVRIFGVLQHVGIVTDRCGHDGCPMVISNSQRRGGVAEETWTDFTQGKEAQAKRIESPLQWWEVLGRARSRIGDRWHLVSWNCEHFVRYSLGLAVKSSQLRTAAVLLLGALALAARRRS